MLFYVGLDERATGELAPFVDPGRSTKMTGLRGHTDDLGDFTVKFVEEKGAKHNFFSVIDRQVHGMPREQTTAVQVFYKLLHCTNSTALRSPGPHQFTESVMRHLRFFNNGTVIGLDSVEKSESPNLLVSQVW